MVLGIDVQTQALIGYMISYLILAQKKAPNKLI